MENKTRGHILKLNLASELTHGICVSNLAYRVAKELELSEELCYELAIAGLVHDIGKLEISKYLYNLEDDPLMIEELKYVRTHSTLGYAILNARGYSEFILQSILHHHENYDGTGYPRNLVATDIPYGARMLRLADAYVSLTSDKPYRKAFDKDTAVELMIEEVKNFDMRYFLTFLKMIHEIDVDKVIAFPKFELDFGIE